MNERNKKNIENRKENFYKKNFLTSNFYNNPIIKNSFLRPQIIDIKNNKFEERFLRPKTSIGVKHNFEKIYHQILPAKNINVINKRVENAREYAATLQSSKARKAFNLAFETITKKDSNSSNVAAVISKNIERNLSRNSNKFKKSIIDNNFSSNSNLNLKGNSYCMSSSENSYLMIDDLKSYNFKDNFSSLVKIDIKFKSDRDFKVIINIL